MFPFRSHVLAPFLMLICVATQSASAADWPMWRHDPQRSAQTEQALPENLFVQWVHKLPALEPAFKNERLQFDAGYEPIVKGQRLFYGSSQTDSVTALDVKTGKELWRFTTSGPVRMAPVAWQDLVIFGSDDGCVYAVSAETGALRWKYQAVPSQRLILGNRRLISVWPVRGGPVIEDDTLYFAAGVWPFEGVFIYALDPETGVVKWVNDRLGFIYGQHPHAAEAFGGITPQGYLVIAGEELIVPCGTAFPARINKRTGELIKFELPKPGRTPGGWFAAAGKAARRGETKLPQTKPAQPELQFDRDVNSARHENGQNYGPDGKRGIRQQIQTANKKWTYKTGLPGVPGIIHSLVAAADRLFVVTEDGSIYCLGPEETTPVTYESPLLTEKTKSAGQTSIAPLPAMFADTLQAGGYAFLAGVPDARLLNTLLTQPNLQIISLINDPGQLKQLQQLFHERGHSSSKLAFLPGPLDQYTFPAYFAQTIITAEPVFSGMKSYAEQVRQLYPSLRPYGGRLLVKCSETDHHKLAAEFKSLSQVKISRVDGYSVFEKVGAIPGSSNYTGGWSSPDELVKAPVGVLWYDDSVGNFKRAPQPLFVDGVMISHSKYWQGYPAGIRPPYKLLNPQFSDVYTGRKLNATQAEQLTTELPTLNQEQKQPSQYRPPYQTNDWSPPPPVIGERTNPLNGKTEPRAFPKSYGCDGGVDYSYVYTMRSGTAAFYDKRVESGTIHISGPRSGCTNSIVPANGLLNVPYYFQGCTCSYPLPVGLSLISLPQTHEQWMVWGKGQTQDIRRVGLNFGAPGDRMTDRGTLWLDTPSVGGPSPGLNLDIQPASVKPFYEHSLWIEGGQGWPWVGASGITGVEQIRVNDLQPGEYTVRLYFREPEFKAPGKRVFSVQLNGQPVIRDLDLIQETGSRQRILVRELTGVALDKSLQLDFTSQSGQPLICGLELVKQGLPLDEVVTLPEQKPNLLTK
ncbi:Alcohol dehydrogenase [cytochrome c] precursor [Gimesia panareensis]|uniref:Alcohol dehydrogenase [cytochrome c] n=1 Tax=Gimesia panareensis TaxID=2527978 RepID=A0A517QAM6_9PLAN|nr:PQQ-binding-like beta-propeller repeat protein [Gimesia panareensis]QDT28686.1 Alcohol dehydrogenase [cytochrome c] precursor [Gimesia panareensis]